MKRLAVAGAIVFAALGGFYLSCLHYTDQYHASITRNLFTGELSCDVANGLHLTAPWVQVARIDLRPARVCITTAGRGFNCRLVEFNPSAYREFVATEGFRYYWWANRVSFNFGYNEEYRGMKDLLRGYAFSVRKYPFITVLRDFSEP